MILIDGDHGVPVPLIDYFYTSDRLAKGGFLLADDVQIPSVQQLCDFLDTEKPRWTFVEQIGRTRIYRKSVEGSVTGLLWREQPFCTVSPPQRGLIHRALRKIRRKMAG
jgi:hypothetical protein